MTIKAIQLGNVTWTDIVNVSAEDVETLRARYPHFHPLELEDIVSHMERPKLDEYDDYLFTVLQVPVWDAAARISRAGEVDIFVGDDYVVTAHDGKLKPIVNLFERCLEDESVRELYLGQGASRLFCTIIDVLVDYIFPILYKVDGNIRRLEEDIFERDTRRMVRDVAFLRRDNIALRRIVRPQVEILANLERVQRPFMSEDLDIYFGDIRDHLHKAIDQINEHAEIIAGLSDTLNTLANDRTNEIVQILTVISVILMPLTLISGIYGMNIDLPFQENPTSFLIISLMMVSTALGMLVFFRWREWL